MVDDLGAVALIAIFYTDALSYQHLAIAGVVMLAMLGCNMAGVRRPLPYLLLLVFMWLAMEGSGVHATVAGILAAMTVPAYTRLSPSQLSGVLRGQLDEFDNHYQADQKLMNNKQQSREIWRLHHILEVGISPLQRLETALHVPVSYFVIPLFALANSAILLNYEVIHSAEHSLAALGVLAGLTVGKLLGVVIPTWIAWKIGLGRMGDGVTLRHLIGAGLLAGIGFTMSIFIAELAYSGDHQQVVYSKIAILFATVISGLAGYLWLRFVALPVEE
ncbi:MAG: NhaA family Na+:H+ antiporter [Parasphingorhabdus sp.]